MNARKDWKRAAIAVAAVAVLGGAMVVKLVSAGDDKASPVSSKPALTVTTTRPSTTTIAASLGASGNIAAWQEAIIGAEVLGLRLTSVRANVGDTVRKGQVLASFATETVEAELAQSRASVAEAEAALAEARTNSARAKTLENTGAMSAQQIDQYITAGKTAGARLSAARAMERVSQLKLAHTQVLAPDDGTISARTATVGAVLQSGQELFRMVRKNRLEWRAEVTSAELAKISVGQKAIVNTPAGEAVAGKVRMIAPTVDPQTRNVQVFVDLEPHRGAKAGMFARGEFALGETTGLTVPQQALVVRDGFAYVFTIKPDSRVQQVKVETGQRFVDRVEIRAGLKADTVIVAQGAGFLNDGDLVRVTTAGAPAANPVTPAPRAAAGT